MESKVIGTNSAAIGDVALLDIQQVAAMLRCSPRHVYRLSDAGKMPRPIRLGAIIRWQRGALESWISEGCPTCRSAVRP